MPDFVVMIPARYASTRLPGKPLLPLAGKPMLAHVHARALASGARAVYVATDDARIARACETFGARALMTAGHHRCGTERLAQACRLLALDADCIVVNVQGDEPLIPTPLIGQVAALLARQSQAQMATLCCPIESREDIFNPSVVKVVFSKDGLALYFSRAPIPWDRDSFADGQSSARLGPHYRHLGIYAYRAGFLARYAALEAGPQERCESLEQLRALHHGFGIAVEIACEAPGPGIDTEADLQHIRQLLEQSDNP